MTRGSTSSPASMNWNPRPKAERAFVRVSALVLSAKPGRVSEVVY